MGNGAGFHRHSPPVQTCAVLRGLWVLNMQKYQLLKVICARCGKSEMRPRNAVYCSYKCRVNARSSRKYYKDIGLSRRKGNAAQKKHRLNNPEHYRQKDRERVRDHPEYSRNKKQRRRARERGNIIDVSSVIHLALKNAKQICYWCGVRLYGRKYHIDHVVPLSKGGGHAASNIVKSCSECNLRKSDKTPNEFIITGQLVLL